MSEGLQLLMGLVAGILFGAKLWREDALEGKATAHELWRYQNAISELDRWCGHESPHARIIAAHLAAVGAGDAMNAGTPHGSEVCNIQGTRDQLRGIDAAKAGNRALFNELADIATALGTTRFMDPPGGGTVHLSEQVRRMREEFEGLESLVANTEWLKAELSTRTDK